MADAGRTENYQPSMATRNVPGLGGDGGKVCREHRLRAGNRGRAARYYFDVWRVP